MNKNLGSPFDIVVEENQKGSKIKQRNAEFIKAWADGATIEYRPSPLYPWSEEEVPNWFKLGEFRVKPEELPDFSVGATIIFNKTPQGYIEFAKEGANNVEFIFDGNTKKLKGVELIK